MNQIEDSPRESYHHHSHMPFIGILIALLIGAAGMYYYEHYFYKEPEEPHTAEEVVTVSTEAETNEITLEQKKVPYKVHVTFDNVLLDPGQRESKLIIMKQKCAASYTKTKDGLFSWGIYSQTKSMVFHGLGVYTVDLSGINENSFVIDNEKGTITIHIPKPELTVEYLPEKTEFFNTSNGLLSFGEMELPSEMQQELEVKGKQLLEDEMKNDKESKDTAEKYAKLSVKDIYEPLIRKMESAAVAAANDEYAVPENYEISVVFNVT